MGTVRELEGRGVLVKEYNLIGYITAAKKVIRQITECVSNYWIKMVLAGGTRVVECAGVSVFVGGYHIVLENFGDIRSWSHQLRHLTPGYEPMYDMARATSLFQN